ncbi:MAG: hypothetical protein VKJ04_01630 [Vampirovibrionales bacterium]|nr:hypothetical protein [Vampirovibrionales bacterium]
MPQTYGPSQLDGYDFSRIKALCDGFYIALPTNPLNGDLLTYNSQAQNWQAKSVLFDLFSAFDHGGGITISNSATDLHYDTEVIQDAIFSHVPDAPGVSVLQEGLFLIQADVALAVTAGSTNSHTALWLAVNGEELEGSRSLLYTFQNGFRGTANLQRLVLLGAGDVIKVQAQLSASGNTVNTVADGSRLTIIRLNSANNGLESGAAMGAGIFSFVTYS